MNAMKRTYRLFLAVLFVLTAISAEAQNEGLTLSLLRDMPYNNYLNPGNRVKYNGIVGFGISNINLGVLNTSIKYDNIYRFENGAPVAIDANKFIQNLNDYDNSVRADFSLDMLNAGFRVNRLFFNIDWRLKMSAGLDYSKDFVGFFILGNGNYMGWDNPADFNISTDATLYSEIGVGVQYEINDKLTVGVRPKLLLGLANAEINSDRTRIYTDPDTYGISASVDLDVRTSSVLGVNMRRIGDITNVFNTDSIRDARGRGNYAENFGLGIDFGASYVINEHWGVSASVCDLGFIKWKNAKVKRVDVEDTQVVAQIIEDISNIDLGIDYKSMVDELLKNVWGNDLLYEGYSYKTYLNTRIMVDGYYELNPMLRITATGQLYKHKDKMYPSFTLAYSGSFLRHFNVAADFTMSKYSGTSVGLGLGFHFGPVNFFAVTDNVMMLSKIGKSTVEMATSYNTADLRLGLVFTIGKLKR